MNSNKISYVFVLLAGIMTVMLTEMASACDPGMVVSFVGPNPEWVHVNCHLPVEAYANHPVSSWRYYVYPGGNCDECDCQWWLPCGNPPATYCPSYRFIDVRSYNVCVDAEEMDEMCNLLDEDTDYKTVYAVKVDLSPYNTTLVVGNPRVRVDLIVQWAGSTTNSIVTLGLGGSAPFAKVWSSQTGGTLLLQGGQSIDWPVGSQPSSVWIEGTAPSTDCILQISCRDKNGVRHPCTEFPHVHFTIQGPPCWGIELTKENKGSCVCTTPGAQCVSNDPQVAADGYGKEVWYTRKCVHVPSGQSGRAQCNQIATQPPQDLAELWPCVAESNPPGVLLCYTLNALVDIVQCDQAATACAEGFGTAECAQAITDCAEALTGEGIDCGCLVVSCVYQGVFIARGIDYAAYGDTCTGQ